MNLFLSNPCSLASFTPLDVQQPQQGETEAPAPIEASQSKSNSLQMRNVYISGLPATMRASEFRDMCQTFGRVEASKLCVDNNCQPTKGYGFALFYHESSAQECMRSLNGQVMGGRPMQARLADTTATPTPLDPGSAHPPLSRDRLGAKGRAHAASLSSMQSDGPFVLTKSLNMSYSPSSQDVTPTMTPPQMSLAPAIVPAIAGHSSLMFHSPLEQPVGYAATSAIPAQQSYAPLSSSFVQSQMVGMPFFVTVPQPHSAAPPAQQSPPQQYVYPAVAPPAGYPQQLYSSLTFQSP